MLTTVQVLLIITLLITLIGSIAEKDRKLSQQMTAICVASIFSLGLSLLT